jgi:hypothetical protein
VFENNVLRKTFRSKREEVEGGWRRLHNEKLHNLYASSNIIRVIKSRRGRWVWHVGRMGAIRNSYDILVGNMKGRDNSKELGADGRIIFVCILGKQGGKLWTGHSWLRISTSDGFL